MKRNVYISIFVGGAIVLSGLGVGLYFALRSTDEASDETTTASVLTPSVGSTVTSTATSTVAAEPSKGAVATSTNECTDAAVDILRKGGSAADSAITAALCQGLTVPQSSGLGGGFLATIYIKATGTIETLNSREIAPAAASKDMYKTDLSSREGGLAVAVPTELKGLFELHKKYGKLNWEEVVQPVIEIAENGFKVTEYLRQVFTDRGAKIRSKPGFREYFIDPLTNEFYEEGDVLKNPKLAEALKIIAKEGSDAIYGGGSLAQGIVDEIQNDGGIVTMEDLMSYEPKWGKPSASGLFNGETIHTFPLPGSGQVINFVINILEGYKFQEKSFEQHSEDKLIYHRIMEAFKFGFAARTKLGDEATADVLQTVAELESKEHAEYIRSIIDDDKTFNDFEHYGANASVTVDHGTGHLSILAPNGDAVGLTSTINFINGAYLMSESTGMLYNNEMNDFSIPIAASDGLLPAPANFIAPGKSPMSSMAPIIVLNDQKDVTLVMGGAGGILIGTSIIQFLVYFLYLNQTIGQSLGTKRLHHQLQPMRVSYEQGYNEEILRFLESKGHVTFEAAPSTSGFASVIAIARKNGELYAATDPRRGGKAVVFQ